MTTFTCQDAILAMLEASGPQHRQDLRRECREQAVPYDPQIFAAAVSDLLATGRIVIDRPCADPVFNLPSYYAA